MSKRSAYCTVVTVAQLQSVKYVIRGFITELFTVIKTILSSSYGLKLF